MAIQFGGRNLSSGVHQGTQFRFRAIQDLPSSDTSPLITGSNFWKTASTSAITYTTFSGGFEGDYLEIVGADGGLSSFQNAGSLKLFSQQTVTLQDNDTLSFVFKGTTWYQNGGSINSPSATAYSSSGFTVTRTVPDITGISSSDTATILATLIEDLGSKGIITYST